MRARTIGTIALGLTGLVLLADVVRNLPTAREDLGAGPAGFPWPTEGLGEVELGVDGAFVLELEERVETEEGKSERVPSMRLDGRDPRPHAEGMSLRDTEIRSYELQEASDARIENLRVVSPRAILPMRDTELGARELDRSQAWLVMEPIVIVPQGLGGEELRLESDDASYHPTDQIIESDGPFVLSSSGLVLKGVGIHLDLLRETVRFGEVDGRLDWELALSGGGKLVGFSDQGGVLQPAKPGHFELTLPAKDESWIELPADSSLPGRLESEGWNLSLRQVGEGRVTESAWMPQLLEGETSTFWSGETHVVMGGAPQLSWDRQGELLGLLIDGSILAREQGKFKGWTTASGGAHLDAATSFLSLWDRVVARTAEMAIFADRVTFDEQQRVLAEGELILSSPQGWSYADTLLAQEEIMQVEQVRAYPGRAEIDRVIAPHMQVQENGTLHFPQPFQAVGQADGARWEFQGNELTAGRDAQGTEWTTVQGGVEGTWQDASWFADSMQREGEVTTLRGAPAELRSPLESGGIAYAQGARIRLFAESVALNGDPVLRLPASALGLRGEEVRIYARRMERDAAGNWHFEHQIRFEGSMRGTARRATFFADGSLSLERRPNADWMHFDLEDGSDARLKAVTMEGHPDRQLELNGDLHLWFLGVEAVEPVEMQGTRAVIRPDGGVLQGGPITMQQGEQRARARRAEWNGDPRQGPFVLHLIGSAWFQTPEAEGQADRMRYDSAEETLELFRGRKQAQLKLQGAQQIEADWLRYHLVDERIDASKSQVSPPDQGEQNG